MMVAMTQSDPKPDAQPDAVTMNLGEKALVVQNLFDGLATHYDPLNQVISLGMHWGWKKKAIQALNLSQGDAVLDVCTGTGDNLGLLFNSVGPDGQVTGLDFSANMLGIARQRYQGMPTVLLQQGDALALPYEDHCFAAALVTFGLRNVENREQCLAEMQRVVKPGGWVVNLDTTPDPWLPGFNWYFQQVMPKLGKLFADNEEAYRYLATSTTGFLSPKMLIALFEKIGLQSVYHKRMALGSVALVAGQKPV
jgi:demethylmenaquinone methyltransferase / 2-methoxy-6-polyprenyl-1,4-benzoquinol methylase